MADGCVRKRGSASRTRLSESVRKTRKQEYDRRRQQRSVYIGAQIDRWLKLKEKLRVDTHEDVAHCLLDLIKETCTQEINLGKESLHRSEQLGGMGGIDDLCLHTQSTPGFGMRKTTEALSQDDGCRQTYLDHSLHKHVFDRLSRLWKDGKMCDASIGNGSSKVLVHKILLIALDPKLLLVYNTDIKEKFLQVTFPDSISEKALNTFANYLYSGVLLLDTDVVDNMETIAHLLALESLQNLCSQFHSHVASLATDEQTLKSDVSTAALQAVKPEEPVDVEYSKSSSEILSESLCDSKESLCAQLSLVEASMDVIEEQHDDVKVQLFGLEQADLLNTAVRDGVTTPEMLLNSKIKQEIPAYGWSSESFIEKNLVLNKANVEQCIQGFPNPDFVIKQEPVSPEQENWSKGARCMSSHSLGDVHSNRDVLDQHGPEAYSKIILESGVERKAEVDNQKENSLFFQDVTKTFSEISAAEKPISEAGTQTQLYSSSDDEPSDVCCSALDVPYPVRLISAKGKSIPLPALSIWTANSCKRENK